MKTYELTYIISSQLNSPEADSVKQEIESFIQSNEGVILKSEKTTPQTLAYPIKKQSSGYFVASELQIIESKIKELKITLEKNKNILRHLITIKKELKKPKRIRKPMFNTETATENKEKKAEKLNVADMDKKLDEILSE